MAFGWQGTRSRLVPLDEERHLENAFRWMNDPEITRWLLAGDLPLTRLAERDWFQKQRGDSDVVFAIETLEGKHIGFTGLHSISWRHGTAVTGTVIGSVEDQSKGYGRDAAHIRTAYAFEVLGLRMLYSSVFEGNERSLRMLVSAGYRECGRYPKKYWKRGSFIDEVLMCLDRNDWTRPE